MTEIIFIGTSDAFGAGGRRQSAYLVRAPSGGALLDCGQTTGTGLAALGISRDEIDVIVVSHFHADHFGGIPLFLLAAEYQDARRKPIRIVGPPTVEARVRRVAMAMGHGIEDHEWSFPIQFQELLSGADTELGPVRARSFETRHSPDSCPHGLIIETGGHRIAYSGDTGWFDELPAEVAGSDLFLCECTQVSRSFEYHLSLDELADRRGHFDVGELVLTHLGDEMRNLTDHSGFDIADDGRVVKL
ncbi:MAG: MBL fold metallo-hydrolase [bacterium]|nr:MBL fold metallo-hydrolase [bacterium]